MGSIFSIADLIDMMRRRIVAIFCVTLLGTILTVVYAMSQQHLYSSSEVLQIQGAKIADELAPSTVAGSSARRLQLIEQQVMSRGAVIEAVAKLGLFADQPNLIESEQVAAVRRAVMIEGVAAAREGYSDDGSVSLLRITANWPTAEGAQFIAHEFARRTINLSIETRLDQARETLDFFELQENGLRAEVTALEGEITTFRAENDLTTPGSLEFTRREIEGIKEATLNIDRQMIALQQRISTDASSRIEKRQREEDLQELANLIEQRALLTSTRNELATSLESSPEIQLQLAKFDREMEDLRAQVQTVSSRRKEAHVSYQLEVQRQSERLMVLEPAPLPDYPFTTARKQIVVLGGIASLLFGLAAAFLLDWRVPVVRSAAQMEHETGLRPVISIPEIRAVRPKGAVKSARLKAFFQPLWRRIVS